MQVDESNEDRSKRQSYSWVLIWNWKGWLSNQSGIDFNDTLTDFLMQVKHNADIYLDRIFSNDHRKREIVKKELIQFVHPSVHVAEVFSSPHVLSTDLVSPLDLRLI